MGAKLSSQRKDAPTAKEVWAARQAPNGQARYGLFARELAEPRRNFFKFVFMTLGVIILFMFALLACYFGSYYDQISRATHFSIEVVDLDSAASPAGAAHPAILGPAVRAAIAGAEQTQPHLGWYEAAAATVQTFRLADGGQGVVAIDYAQAKVLNQDVWGVLIVNANATSGVWDALTSGAEWSPMGAMTFVYEEARNFYGTDQYVARLALQLMTSAGGAGASTLAGQVLALSNASAVVAAAPAGSLAGAFSYSQYDLRPFDELAGIAATTVGTIYLIIFTFLISVAWNTRGLPLIQEKLAIGSEIAVKLLVPLVAYFWLSLHYSLVSLAFLVTFNRYYGYVGFFIYWMLNWVSMSALGFVMETFFLLLGPFFPFFLIFWVILNVSVAFLDIADMQDFYRYGYMMPVWNTVDGSKSLIFGTKNHLPQNFLVNIGWLVVFTFALGTTVLVQRRKKEAEKMKKVWAEMSEKDGDRTVGPVE
ncbi:hypothetical protein Q5752_002325 [Cryptotrichosporon argae]